MPRVTTQKELEAVLRLDGPARYEHFVKRVADEEIAWGSGTTGGRSWATTPKPLRSRSGRAREYA